MHNEVRMAENGGEYRKEWQRRAKNIAERMEENGREINQRLRYDELGRKFKICSFQIIRLEKCGPFRQIAYFALCKPLLQALLVADQSSAEETLRERDTTKERRCEKNTLSTVC